MQIPAVLALGLLLPCLDLGTAERNELARQAMEGDDRKWADVQTVTGQHEVAPSTWARIDEPGLGLTAYFPCKPETDANSDRSKVTGTCMADGKLYELTAISARFPSERHRHSALVGMDFGLQKSLVEKFGAANLIPVAKVRYGDASGRESDLLSGRLGVRQRVLVRGNLVVQMMVSRTGLPDAESARVFFDAIELAPASPSP